MGEVAAIDPHAIGVTAAVRPAHRGAIALGLMWASGFAGLGYQIVWTQQASLWLGHEAAAVLAVVAAFFGGLALGAFGFGARIERSARPVRWYVACELVVALWAGVLMLVMAPFGDAALAVIGVQPSALWQWRVAFGGTFMVLLPATAAMGATLPAMERLAGQYRLAHGAGRSIATLYAANTFGAVAGVLVSAFWWVPAFGLTRAAALCIGLNLLCAVAALGAFAEAASPGRPEAVAAPSHALASARRAAWLRLACTGLLGIGYEVLVARVLGQVTEDTVYTFALLLAVYLAGSAFGAAAWQRGLAAPAAATPPGGRDLIGDRLLGALAAACLASMGTLWAAERIKDVLLASWGSSMATALAAEAALGLAAFGLPTVVMGAAFSHFCARANAAGASFGRSLAANTAGAALAPLVFGVLLASAWGPKAALVSVALGYLALASRSAWRGPAVLVPFAAALVVLAAAPPLAFVDVPEGGRIVSYRDGAVAAVSVVEDAEGVARLRINNRQQEGSSSSLFADARQALLPVLLHPAPRRALFLGLGTGMTAASATLDPALHVDAVELLPEVIEASALFGGAFVGVFEHPPPPTRLQLIAADARRYVRATSQGYDVIVSDNFHPARSGSGALYTVEHFAAVRARLSRDGLFCQWLPLHQLDLPTLRSVVRSFMQVYPGGAALLASNSLETPVIGLVGRADDGRFDRTRLRARLAAATWSPGPVSFGIEDEFALLGSFVGGPSALNRFAGDAPPNTDDHPVVAYAAPRATYAPASPPRDRLLALIKELGIGPDEIVDTANDRDVRARLAAYRLARDRFLAAGRDVRPVVDAAKMLAQVRDPLLAIVRISPDFRPAYDPLRRLAMALMRTDPAAAQALLDALARAREPAQDVGRESGMLPGAGNAPSPSVTR